MEKHEDQREFSTHVRPMGVTFAVTLNQAVCFEFVEVIAPRVRVVSLVGYPDMDRCLIKSKPPSRGHIVRA